MLTIGVLTEQQEAELASGPETDPLALKVLNNLGDLGSVATARSNLGLGSAALLASSAVLLVANNLSDLASAATARTNLGLGTAATQNVGAFAQTANNLSDLANAGTARTNLGLGTMATQAASAVAITGGTIVGLTGLAIRDTSAAFDVTIAAVSSTVLTAGRTLTLNMVNAARSIKLAGNIDIAGNLTTSGANALTLTTTGVTNVTLPTTGTLAILAANTFIAVQSISLNAAAIPAGETGTVLNLGNADTVVSRIQLTGFGAQAFFSSRRANGTAAVPTALVTDDQIGAFNWGGYQGSNGYSGAQASIAGYAAENWSNSSNPTYLALKTTPSGSTTLTEAVRVNADGTTTFKFRLGFSGTTNPGLTLNSLTTTQRDAISSPVNGMLIYNSTTDRVNQYAASAWKSGFTRLEGDTMTGTLTITPAVNTKGLVISGYSITDTTSRAILDLSGTFNNSGLTGTLILANLTDTSSIAGSLLMDLQVGGSSKFNVAKSGAVTSSSGFTAGSTAGMRASDFTCYTSGSVLKVELFATTPGVYLSSDSFVAWRSATDINSGSNDTFLYRDAANTLALRNSTSAQTFNVYNTWTDASNYERLALNFSSNIAHIGNTKAGTGTARVLQIDYGGTTTAAISVPITSGMITLGGNITTLGGATFHTTSTALTDGAGAGAGTITNAPAVGNPTKWIGINDNGTTRYIPAW